MKRSLLFLLLMAGLGFSFAQAPSAVAQERERQTTHFTTASSSGSTSEGDSSVTFVFSSTFTGTLGTEAQAYSGANDTAITISAADHHFLAAIPYTVTAGSIRIIEVR